MDIFGIVTSIVDSMIEKAVDDFFKPLFELIEMVALSPETLAKMPWIDSLYDVNCSIGIAILILVTSWQSIKSMNIGLGFEADEPHHIAFKSFVAVFLIFNLKDIMLVIVKITSNMISFVLEVSGSSIDDFGIFNMLYSILTLNLIYIILGLILLFKMLGLALRMFERLVMCALLIVCSPLAVASMVSKTTEGFWQGFIKLFVGNVVIQVVQTLCIIALFASISLIEGGEDYVPRVFIGNVFYIMLSTMIVTVMGKLEDIIKDISISVGVGRDMQGALGKIQGVAYTTMTVSSGIGRAFGK